MSTTTSKASHIVNATDMRGKTWKEIIRIMLENMEDVTEIETNGTTSLFYKHKGQRLEVADVFRDEADYVEKTNELIDMVKTEEEKLINPTDKFLVEGRLILSDGNSARVHLVMPPAADTPQVTIAKKSTSLPSLEAIQAKGSMTMQMLDYIKAAVSCNMTIVISGGTGAGKALHKSTKIPTPNGWTTVEKAQVGDIILDENGKPTKIELKYCPNDPKSYEIVFSNGQVLRTSAGHLWEVIETFNGNSERKIVSSEKIAEKGKENYQIKKITAPIEYNGTVSELSIDELVNKITKDKEIDDNALVLSVEDRIKITKALVESIGEKGDDLYTMNVSSRQMGTVIEELLSSLAIEYTKDSVNTESYVISFNPIVLDNSCKLAPMTNYTILEINEVEDNPEDYFCFQVDSPSHLFLCTESFIPTHNTTMLEAMTKLFDDSERISVVEDLPELKLQQPNVTYTHSTLWAPGRDKNDVATLQWCVAQVNRARADKIIIGETRGGEFAEFIMAANSGKEGSLTTIHANNARACLQKMSQFMIIGQPQPVRLANESIASSVHLIIQLGFNAQRQNRVLEIVEVSRTLGNSESAVIATTPIFQFDRETDSWHYTGTISDDTRQIFQEHGYNPKTFQKSVGFGGESMANLNKNPLQGGWGGFIKK